MSETTSVVFMALFALLAFMFMLSFVGVIAAMKLFSDGPTITIEHEDDEYDDEESQQHRWN